MPDITLDSLLAFFRAYVAAALFSSRDSSEGGNDEPLDALYSIDDLANPTRAAMLADCLDFLRANLALVESNFVRAGHDFWLTRNHHGAGFWDGDWPDDDGRKLTDAAHTYGEVDLYVGDDGNIWQSGAELWKGAGNYVDLTMQLRGLDATGLFTLYDITHQTTFELRETVIDALAPSRETFGLPEAMGEIVDRCPYVHTVRLHVADAAQFGMLRK